MNVKTYIAATTRDALRMVREELGDEAVILSNRKVGNDIEIMAMSNEALCDITGSHPQPDFARPDMAGEIPQLTQSVDMSRLGKGKLSERKELLSWQHSLPQVGEPSAMQRKSPASTAPQPAVKQVAAGKVARSARTVQPKADTVLPPDQAYLAREIKSMHSMLQEQFSCLAWSDLQQRDPKRTSLLRKLVNAGFGTALAHQLLDKMPQDADQQWINQVLAHNLQGVSQGADVVARGGVYALTGPTGVGKTTTTAKLAARAVVRYGADSVALITTDGYRIGALEQLRIYGKILGVAVHAARDTADLQLTLSGLRHKRLVLIDTMGMGQRDKRLAEQSAMFDASGVQRLLLLNATSSGDTLEDVVRMYHGKGVIGSIATKLDEAATLGGLLDVLIRNKLPLHFVANGQRVPEDLHEVNLTYLLHRAFESTVKPAAFAAGDLDIPALMAGHANMRQQPGAAYAL